MLYSVKYFITEVEADNPLEAVKAAVGLMNAGLKSFIATDEQTKKRFAVDLNEGCKEPVIEL